MTCATGERESKQSGEHACQCSFWRFPVNSGLSAPEPAFAPDQRSPPVFSLKVSRTATRATNSANDTAARRPSGIGEPASSFRFACWSRGDAGGSPATPPPRAPPRGFAAQESEKRLAVFYPDRRGLVATEKPLRGIEHRLVRTGAVMRRRNRREIRTDLTAEPFDARAGGAGGGGVKNLTALARGSAVPGAEFRSVASVRGGESPSNNDPLSARSSLPPARCNWARAGPVNGGARWRSAMLASVWASIAAIARQEESPGKGSRPPRPSRKTSRAVGSVTSAKATVISVEKLVAA